jgi:hypothetical protein
LLLPLIGVLVYLIARGGTMHEHQVQDAQVQARELRQYVQQATGSQSSADQLAKLADLRDQGVIHPRHPAAVTWYWAGQLPDMLTQVKGPVIGLERPVAAGGPASSTA